MAWYDGKCLLSTAQVMLQVDTCTCSALRKAWYVAYLISFNKLAFESGTDYYSSIVANSI